MSRPRIRTLKPENWEDEAVGSVSREARLLRDVLVTFADDDGRWRHLPRAIIGFGYPYDDDLTPAKIKRWTGELVNAGLVILYDYEKATYGCFPTWHSHQHINKYTPSELPPCDDSRVVPRPADVEGTGAGRRGPKGYKKVAIPERVRREVARRYGGEPGAVTTVACELCQRPGEINWEGSASWVSFSGLHLDHRIPEMDGGTTDADNIWLLCKQCNVRKGTKRITTETVTDTRTESVDGSVCEPPGPPRVGAAGSGSVPLPSDPVDDAGVRDPRLIATVEILRSAPRFQFDPELMGVANTLAAFPNADHVKAAHIAVANVSDPNYRTTDAGKALRYAIGETEREQRRGGSPKPVPVKKPWDGALQQMVDEQNGRAA